MKQKFFAGAIVTALAVGIHAVPLQMVHAAQVHVEENAQMLAEAIEELEDGTYAEGEALVSMESSAAVALAREGTYRFDKDVTVESVSNFGTDDQTGKEIYIVHLTSDKYSAEELMELALSQYYVDGVCANQYRQLCAVDPYQGAQWYLDGAGTLSKGIRYSKQSVTGQNTPVIAVIDTGVNYTHPDLADSMWNNAYPGTLSGTYGYDFADNDADPMDYNGHGTHVAGIAAAKSGNNIGIAGVAAAKIMALKVVHDENVEMRDDTIIRAYEYIHDAMEAGVNVKAVNCSWGGSHDTNGVLSRAINAVGELGALSVFAAGNDHVDWDYVNRALPTPYDLDSPYVVIVGASDEQDQVAFFSDYGAKHVDLFAPGAHIFSTYIKNMYLPDVYDSAQQKKFTSYYNCFDDSSANILPEGQTWRNYYTAQELGISTEYTVKITPAKDGDNGYLKMKITRNRVDGLPDTEAAGSVYVDVTDLKLDTNATYYVAFQDGELWDSSIEWQESNFISSKEQSRFVEKDGRTYMRIVGLSIPEQSVGEEYVWYLDNIAISAPNPDPEAFGAYAHQSGSSMSAPIVSAAVAMLGATNPMLSAKSIRTQLLKCVRKVSSLSDKCVTGGILDTSKISTLATKVTLNKTTATLRYGKSLTLKARVSPSYVTSTRVKWKSSNTKYALVSSTGVVRAKKAGIGHTVTISATTMDGSNKKAVCKIKLKK